MPILDAVYMQWNWDEEDQDGATWSEFPTDKHDAKYVLAPGEYMRLEILRLERVLDSDELVVKPEVFTMETAIGVAARIWCDPDYSHVAMNTGVAFRIAKMLYALANKEDRE